MILRNIVKLTNNMFGKIKNTSIGRNLKRAYAFFLSVIISFYRSEYLVNSH